MNLDFCLRIKHAWSLRRFEGRNRSAFASLLRDGEDPIPGRCRPESGWNLEWRILRSHEGIVSGGKVNWLIDGFCGERLPTIDLAHVDLPWCQQRPQQHRDRVRMWPKGFALFPSLYIFSPPLAPSLRS